MAALALTPALFFQAHSPQAAAAEIRLAQPEQSTGKIAPVILLAQAKSDGEADASDIGLRFGRHDEYDRFVFEWQQPVEVDFSQSGSELVLTFDRASEATLPPENDFTYQTDRLPQLVFAVRTEDGGRRYRIDIDPDVRFRIHRWNDGRLIAVDIFQPTPSDAPGAATAVDAEPDTEAEAVVATPVPRPETAPSVPDPIPVEVPDEPAPEAPEPATDADDDLETGGVEDMPKGTDDEEIPEQDVDDPEVAADEPYEKDEQDEEREQEGGGGFTTAGPFEIDLGGSLQFGVSTAANDRLSNDDGGDRGYSFFTDADVSIDAYTTVLGDVDVGTSVSLEADANVTDTANADEAYIYIDNGFGDFRFGRTSGAEDDMALGADTIAAGTGGIDGDTANLGDTEVEASGDAAKVSYFTPRVGGFQFGASYTPDVGDEENDDDDGFDLENHIGVGLNFVETFGGVELGLATVGSFGGSEFSDSDDLSAYAVGGTLEFDAVELGASYGRSASDFDFDFATLGVTLGFGEIDAGVGYNFLDEDDDGTTHVVVLSGDAPILPGVELQGDVSFADPENDDDNVASVLAVEFGF